MYKWKCFRSIKYISGDNISCSRNISPLGQAYLWRSKWGSIPRVYMYSRGNIYSAWKYCYFPHILCWWSLKFLNAPNILQLCPKTYLAAQKNYMHARIFLSFPTNILTFLTTFQSIPGNLFASPEIYSLPQKLFVPAQKLLCSMRGFFVSDLFGNAVVP